MLIWALTAAVVILVMGVIALIYQFDAGGIFLAGILFVALMGMITAGLLMYKKGQDSEDSEEKMASRRRKTSEDNS